MDMYNLKCFLDAQADSYEHALRELQAGQKHSHWMWFVFPQFAGLGMSSTSQRYAIGSTAEALEYLSHLVLGARLLECTRAINQLEGLSARQIFGKPDDTKLCSSMTLFEIVAGPHPEFGIALEKYFGGRRDSRTLDLVRRA